MNNSVDEKYAVEQRRAIWDFAKTVGSKLFEGKDLSNISMPVAFFQPISYFERITQSWIYIHFLNEAKSNFEDSF